jgi:hypothetical protein
LTHTTSKYCSNKLQEVLNNKTEHFIIKSFVTAAFEYDRKIPEYWLYWYNPNKGANEENPQYRFLSNKKMNKKEVRFFYDVLTSYEPIITNKDGNVWHHKDIKFSKNKVVFKQLKLWY